MCLYLKRFISFSIGMLALSTTFSYSSSAQPFYHNTIVRVGDYGAKGDGINDDSYAILRAINALDKDGSTLVFESGKTYLLGDGKLGRNGTGNSYSAHPNNIKRPYVDCITARDLGRDIRLLFKGNKNLIIEGNGAIIKSHPGNGECTNNAIMLFSNCESVTVNNLILNGSSDQRKPKYNDYSVYGENNRGNFIAVNCVGLTLNNVSSLNSMMDGFNITGDSKTTSKSVTLYNCISRNAYRNGLTLFVHGALIRGGEYSFTGYLSDGKTEQGIMPMAGIDIETGYDSIGVKDVIIDSILCENNKVSGVVFNNASHNCFVKNSIFINNGVNSTSRNASFNEVLNNHFSNGAAIASQPGEVVKGNIFDIDISKMPLNRPIFDTGMKGNESEDVAVFEDNIINADLSSLKTKKVIFKWLCGVRLFGNLIVKNNTFRNVYSFDRIIWGYCSILVDNKFILDEENITIMPKSELGAHGTKLTWRNTVQGYQLR